MAEKLIISRFQQRRGPREQLPQPLREAELALTSDTRQVWMGDGNLAPFGIRAFSPAVTVSEVDEALSEQIVSIVFPGRVSQALYHDLIRHFRNVLDFDALNDPVTSWYNTDLQLVWDGRRTMFFGLRVGELLAATEFDPAWGADPAEAVRNMIDSYPQHDFPMAPQRVQMASEEFQQTQLGDLDWQTVDNGNRILNFNNFDMDRTTGRGLSELVNRVRGPNLRPRMLLNVLDNIELGVIDVFSDPDDPDESNQLLGQLPQYFLDVNQPQFVPTGARYPTSESDVLFVDYSINGDVYRGTGTLMIVAMDSNTVAVMDNRAGNNVATGTPVNPPPLSVGELGLSAQVDGDDIILTYRNTTPRNVTLRVFVRRWQHGNGDFS